MAPSEEWSALWKLPLTAMLGMSGSTIFAFSSGVFMEPMTAAFGWSRAQFSSAFTFQMIFGLILLPLLGRLIDRVGARRVALVGGTCFVASFMLLALVDGVVVQWWGLCILLAVFQTSVTQAVWISSVVRHFHASRGLAMAVTLAGLGLGSLVWPILAAVYIQHLGWRLAFPALGLTWGAIALPLTALFFLDSRQQAVPRAVAAAPRAGRGDRRDLLSVPFITLAIAGGLFACAYYGLMVHLVPLLHGNGLKLATAAGITGLVGAFSMAGRITTGYLLDHVPARRIGGIVFLTPVAVAWLLWRGGDSIALSALAAALLGIASGAEIDIVTYIVAQRFRPEVFASAYAIMMATISVCASMGPTLAGAVFDHAHSYTPYLMAIVPMAVIGAALVAFVRDENPQDPASVTAGEVEHLQA